MPSEANVPCLESLQGAGRTDLKVCPYIDGALVVVGLVDRVEA